MIALLLALTAARAADAPEPDWSAAVHGHVKSFGVATLPYDHVLMGDPSGQGLWNGRVKLEVGYRDLLRFEAHHAVNAALGGAGDSAFSGFGTGVTLTAPQVVDLSWDADLDGDTLGLSGVTDRLTLGVSRPGVDVTLGRQPISFGTGLFFTPLDLVNPFTPTTIDTEYKPGVDAVRVDGYAGTSGRATVVAAYAGDWSVDGVVLAAQGQGTVGVTDLGGFLGLVHGEPVVGASVASSAGPLGLHGDAALTVPPDDDPFVRAVVGADGRPTGTTGLSGELYVQTLGTTDPDEFLVLAQDERWARGELWNWGVAYGAVSVSQELTPLLAGSVAVIANLTDPSAMVAPSVSWSVADNASLSLGGYAGVGARPDPLDLADLVGPTGAPLTGGDFARTLGLNSEFGTYPLAIFATAGAWF